MNDGDSQSWAEREFGTAGLGDTRRLRRLIRCAAVAASRPSGKITAVFAKQAEREAAFRLVENESVDGAEVAAAAHRACATRASAFPHVFVPVDGSSLNLTDDEGGKRLGAVGARVKGATGLQVMSAIAVSPEGVPLGLCGQVYWARVRPAKRKGRRHDRRRVEQKETRYWLEVMEQTRQAFSAQAPKTQPWFQLDRGGDAWPVILDGLTPGQLFTVRAAYDRRLWADDPEQERRYVRQALDETAAVGSYNLEVPPGPNRQGRRATIDVRVAPVTLRLLDERTARTCPAELYAVLARETSPVPSTEEPLEWLLLTSYRCTTMKTATRVLDGYAQRWRIEEFHRVWKTGACRVEETQLGDRDNIVRWAVVLASVAMRILRLTHLARHQPELAATCELNADEIDAVLLLRKPRRQKADPPTIEEVTLWLAELGGYTGKSSGGPPGPLVIARGLARVEPIVAVLKDSAEM
jgi:hypothetical protein